MYCTQCGQAIGDQPQCGNCGAPSRFPIHTQGIPPALPVAVSFGYSRIAGRIHTLGILWIAFGIYSALGWFIALPFLHGFFAASPMWIHSQQPAAMMGIIFHGITIFIVLRAILYLLAGVSLLTRQPWGRVFAIVVAAFTLIHLFLGTILAIYTLCVLLSRDARDYERMAPLHGIPL